MKESLDWRICGNVDFLTMFGDPDFIGNSEKFQTGEECLEKGCEEMAGNALSSIRCSKHAIKFQYILPKETLSQAIRQARSLIYSVFGGSPCNSIQEQKKKKEEKLFPYYLWALNDSIEEFKDQMEDRFQAILDEAITAACEEQVKVSWNEFHFGIKDLEEKFQDLVKVNLRRNPKEKKKEEKDNV